MKSIMTIAWEIMRETNTKGRMRASCLVLAWKKYFDSLKEEVLTTLEKFMKLGGKLWEKNEMKRVYITASIFNELMDTRFSDSKNKFFLDVKTSCLMRSYKSKKPMIEKEY